MISARERDELLGRKRCPCALALAIAAGLLGWAGFARAFEAPSDVYGELFVRVQIDRVYADSKTFCDAVARLEPAQILAEYRAESGRPDFDLRRFVDRYFETTPPIEVPSEPAGQRRDVAEYIEQMWPRLERQPDPPRARSSLLALPRRYVVPGGRFTEIYYWDSYFTMLGLEQSGRHELTVSMLANFGVLLDRYGFIPNGNRSYYLSRSQPPFFALMVELVAQRDGSATYTAQLARLKREHAFWMDGAERLQPGAAYRRVVRLADGTLLNRYWDDRDTPRDEAYREDVQTASGSARPAAEVYRNLRAAAESGWDFSSRWLTDDKRLATIRTTDLIPPDLNSLLVRLEVTIAKGCSLSGDVACERDFLARAGARKRAIQRHLWNEALGAFTDYDWRAQVKGRRVHAATLYPLYLEVSTREQARRVAATVRASLLRPFGLATTTVTTDQQWDASNGWAPLQWIAVSGLRNFGYGRLAQEIAQRWIGANQRMFQQTGRLMEKYHAGIDAQKHAGGEYPIQDGFGWTNGVLAQLLALYPDAKRGRASARAAAAPP